MATEDGSGDFGGAADLLAGAGAGNVDGAGTGGGDGGAPANEGGDGRQAGGDGAGAAAPDWFEKVSAQTAEGETTSNRDFLVAKGFKDLDGLVKSYREAEKGLRDSGRIKIPGEGAKPEEVTAFRTAIGVPEAIEGYELKMPEGVQANEPLLKLLSESALKHGAPKGAFEGLVSDFVQAQIDEAATETKRQDELAAGWVKEQGGKANEQLAHIDTAARSLGLTKTDMMGLRSGLGADRALGLLAKLGAGMAEDVLITGGSNRFGVSGKEAVAELDRLKGDAEFQAKNKPGSPERQRWDRLNRMAAEHLASQEQDAA